ncbi:MAG: transaldolase family protein [Cyanobacteriota bacterium]
MALRLFLDSADTETWAEIWPLGLFWGITTNPTLLRRSGRSCDMDGLGALAALARDIGCGELHLQAWGTTDGDLLACGRSLLALAPDLVVVKLPLTASGLRAARVLQQAGERVTLTACYGIPQVIAAAALGVTYVAPYLGRISDSGRDGAADVLTMGRCLRGVDSSTRLLVASLRSLAELTNLAAEGLDTFTLSPALARQLWTNAATAEAVRQFEADALGQSPIPSCTPAPSPASAGA